MATEAARPAAAPGDERVRKSGWLSGLLSRPELGALLGVVLVWTFFAIFAADNNFISLATTASILNRAAPLGILAVAVALLMIAGEFDLSIGSILGFAGMAILILITSTEAGGFGWTLFPAILVALALSLLVGLFNGWLVVTTRLPSFIITLGTLFVFRGITIAFTRFRTNRTQLGGLDQVEGSAPYPNDLSRAISKRLGAASERRHPVVGRPDCPRQLGVTADSLRQLDLWDRGAVECARNVGVPTRRVKVHLFMTTAFAAFLVALIQAAQFTGADTLRGTQQEFQAIHRGGHRRLLAHRRLRLGGRSGARRTHLRIGPARHRDHGGRRRSLPGFRRCSAVRWRSYSTTGYEGGRRGVERQRQATAGNQRRLQSFGTVVAIKDISMFVRAGEVTCLLGDNGAGKSTLIKTLSGVHKPDEGEYVFEDERMSLSSPHDALERHSDRVSRSRHDSATVDLEELPSSDRSSPRGFGRSVATMRLRRTTRAELGKMGIDIHDPDQAVGTLSGGERPGGLLHDRRAVDFDVKVRLSMSPPQHSG